MNFQIIFSLICSMAYFSYAAGLSPIFNAGKCPNGCQSNDQCPANSACNFLNNQEEQCGFCICLDGYHQSWGRCVGIKGYTTSTTSTTTTPTTTTSTTTVTTTTATTTTAATTTTTTASTTTGTTTQSPTPPNPDPVNCADFNCNVNLNIQTNDQNPLVVKSSIVNTTNTDPNCKRQLSIPPRPCNLKGGGACYGVYCLNVEPNNDYCICSYYRVDRQCAVDKPGKCELATGTIPSGNTQLQNKRLRNPTDKDNGDIYGRSFAANLQDCIKLCQWSKGACRSVNYGPINGANVCEQLSTAATPTNLLAPWLVDANGWTYAQVDPVAN